MLSGCTARMPVDQLRSLGDITFKVVHDDLAERLVRNLTMHDHFQEGLDSLAMQSQNFTIGGADSAAAARAAADLMADVIRMLSPLLQTEAVRIQDALPADPLSVAGHIRGTWTFENLTVEIECHPFARSRATSVAGVPRAPSIEVLGDAVGDQLAASRRADEDRRQLEAHRRALRSESLAARQAAPSLVDEWTSQQEVELGAEDFEGDVDDLGRRLFINLSMLYGMNMGMKSNGILIGKRWIFSAMDVMKGLLLGAALASARGLDWMWDTTMDWIQDHIPGDSWHVRTVGAMFKGMEVAGLQDIVELLDLDYCGMVNSVLLYFDLPTQPCWLFIVVIVVVLILVLYIYYLSLKYCSICACCVSCCKGLLRCLDRSCRCCGLWEKAYDDLPQGAFEERDTNLDGTYVSAPNQGEGEQSNA